jgi:hypothetical protein
VSGRTGPAAGTTPRVRARRILGGLAQLLLPVVVSAGVLAGCLFLQMAALDAVVAALAAGGLTLAVRVLDKGADHAWQPAADVDTDGTRRDVAHLTWSLVGRDGRVSEAAVRRLRDDARRRLRRVGVVLSPGFPVGQPTRAGGAGSAGREDRASGDAPLTDDHADDETRARALLGEPAWSVLTGTGGWLPTLDEVERCVEALERLAPPVTAPPARPAPTRTAAPGAAPRGTGPADAHPDGRTLP